MKKKSASISTAILLICLALLSLSFACVTVNVNLPEGTVQQASDDYVRELYKAKERGKNPSPTPAPSVSPSPSGKPQSHLDLNLISLAYADGLRTDSETSAKIKDRQASRLDDLLAAKHAGVIGEGNDGLLVMKNSDPAKKLLQKKYEKLLNDENADRTLLYSEIIRINGITKSNLKTVEKSYAHSFQLYSPSGTWIQDDDGKWSQKP